MISAIYKKTLHQDCFCSKRGRFKFVGIINKMLVQATVHKPRKIKLISLVLNKLIFPICKHESVVLADDILLKGNYPIT